MSTRESPKSSRREFDKVEPDNGPQGEADSPKEEEVPQDVVKSKRFTPERKLALILAFLALPLIVIWSLRPFDRIIDYLLPPVMPSGAHHETKIDIEPVFARPSKHNKDKFPFRQCGPNATLCCNGLENLCDLKVNDVMFATLHNAMATQEDGYLLNPSHYFPLESALEAGYRGIHLEVCKCNGVYELCHGICKLGARNPTEVFLNIVRFLRDNRQDILLVNLQINSHAHQEVDLQEFYQLLKNTTRFSRHLYSTETELEEWPTLRSMIDEDKRILVFHSDGPSCINAKCPPGFYHAPDYWLETDPGVGLEDIDNSCVMKATNSSKDPATHFYSLNHFVGMPDHGVSEKLNEFDFVARRVASCAEVHSINSIAIDFWNAGNIVEFVQRHNKGRISTAL